MILLLYSILVLAGSFWTALYDTGRIKVKKIDLNHASRFFFRCLFIGAVSLLAASGKWTFLIYMLYFSAVFYIPFDVFLNLLRGLPYWYLGKGAVYDRFWQKLISNKKWAGICALVVESTILVFAYFSIQ